MQEPIRILMLFTIMNRGGAETMVMNYYRNIDRTKVQFDFMVHREERGAYDDEIEALGIERARAAMKQSQVIFYLLDASAEDLQQEIAEFKINSQSNIQQTVAVWNKIDLAEARELPDTGASETVKISARTGKNLDELLNSFEKLVWHGDEKGADAPAAVNARHLALLQSASEALEPVAGEIAYGNWELAAAGLRMALVEAGKIVGETVEPDLLDEIFSRFCIGK